jgi:hypothetical protein
MGSKMTEMATAASRREEDDRDRNEATATL